MRDLFDVYFLFNDNHHLIDDELLNELFESEVFNKNFVRYKENNYVYTQENLKEIFDTFKKINELVQIELNK